MDCHCYDITYPTHAHQLDQNEEYVTLVSDDEHKKVLLHDYEQIYEIPGLYEEVLYNHLKCCSPQKLCSLLNTALSEEENTEPPLRVLDFGAGNGVAGEQIKEHIGCETIVGVDILEKAKKAALRDRPVLYDDYIVADFTNLNDQKRGELEAFEFNTLFSVAALGYDHIGTQAFLNAFDLVSDDAWVVFNIKDLFLSEEDSTGFRTTIETLIDQRLNVYASQRYVHRYSIADEPLYYVGIVGKKQESATGATC
jgi:predicted TPR repeat methyltransferase